MVADARAAGPTMVLDAGSLLYSKTPVPPQLDAQEELKADLLAQTYQTELAVSRPASTTFRTRSFGIRFAL